MKKKVIVYGLSVRAWTSCNLINEYYEIIAFSDSNPDKANKLPIKEIPYVLPENIASLDFDFVIITSVYVNEITEKLVNSFNIDNKKIISDYVMYKIWLKEHWNKNTKNYGEDNEDKKFAVLQIDAAAGGGILSIYKTLLVAVNEVLEEGYIPVIDMKSYINACLEEDEVGKINAWEYFFEQPSNISLDEINKGKYVVLDNVSRRLKYVINKPNHTILNAITDKNVRKEYSEISNKYMHFNEKFNEIIEKEYTNIFNMDENHKVLGLRYRGTDYHTLRPAMHDIQPTMEQFFDKVKQLISEWGYENEYIYFATDDERALEKAKFEFGDKLLYYNGRRFSDLGDKMITQVSLYESQDKYLKAVDYILEMVLLSRCNSLISCRAGALMPVLLWNNCNYEKEYIFNLGVYGIDEEYLCELGDHGIIDFGEKPRFL